MLFWLLYIVLPFHGELKFLIFAVANIANKRVRVMLTYARQYRRQRTERQRLRNFWINKNKMVA